MLGLLAPDVDNTITCLPNVSKINDDGRGGDGVALRSTYIDSILYDMYSSLCTLSLGLNRNALTLYPNPVFGKRTYIFLDLTR